MNPPTTRLSFLLCPIAFAFAACGTSRPTTPQQECDGGPPSSSGGVSGSVTCDPLHAVDSTSWSLAQESSYEPGEALGAQILILDSAGACADLQADSFPPNTTYLNLGVFTNDATGAYVPPGPGDYPVKEATTGNSSTATFAIDDATCQPGYEQGGNATGGNVHIASIDLADGGGVSGSFDLTFGSDRLSGSFNAAACPGTFSTARATCK